MKDEKKKMMFTVYSMLLWILVLIVCFIGSSCAPHKELVTQYVYVPCNVPATPDKPKYIRVQFQQDAQGMIEFTDDNSAKGLLLNDLMNRSYIEDLRTILNGMREAK